MRTFAAATSARPATSSVIRKTQFDRRSSGTDSARRMAGIARNIIVIGAHRSVKMNGDRQACVERLVPPGHAQQTVQHEPSRASEQADDEALVQDAAPDGERNETADGVPHWRAADPLVQRAAPAAFALRRSRLKHHLIKPAIEQEVAGNGNDEDEDSRDRGFGRQRGMPAVSDQPALEPDEPRGRGPWKPPRVRRECAAPRLAAARPAAMRARARRRGRPSPRLRTPAAARAAQTGRAVRERQQPPGRRRGWRSGSTTRTPSQP